MSFSTEDDLDRNGGALAAEKTLRLIASLPAPQGIEDRVKSGVRAAHRRASVMSWPNPSTSKTGWSQVSAMRAAAAAAIVFVVAGGGWEVYSYSHIRVAPVPTAVAAPQRVDGGGGLSAAAAKRTPRTLDGPRVAVPVDRKQKTSGGKANVLPQDRVARPLAVKSSSSLPVQ
ncbi:MAG: hypothetical protein WBQ95_11465 [Terracidiphilus sp.]